MKMSIGYPTSCTEFLFILLYVQHSTFTYCTIILLQQQDKSTQSIIQVYGGRGTLEFPCSPSQTRRFHFFSFFLFLFIFVLFFVSSVDFVLGQSLYFFVVTCDHGICISRDESIGTEFGCTGWLSGKKDRFNVTIIHYSTVHNTTTDGTTDYNNPRRPNIKHQLL